MGAFSLIVQGSRARKRVESTTITGQPFACDLRAVVGVDDAAIFAEARAFAKARGVAEPKEGEPLYDLGLAVHTLAIACVDSDFPADKPAAFFDGGPSQILEHLDRDRILYLYETLTSWQSTFSPRAASQTWPEYVASVYAIATAEEGSAEDPFVKWAPGLRASWARTSAGLLLSSLAPKSPSGTDSDAPTTPAPSASASADVGP